MRRLMLFGVAMAMLVAGCGSESSSGTAGASTAAATTAASTGGEDAMKHEDEMASAPTKAGGTRLKAVGSEYGTVIANGRGEALYLFDRERKGRSECYGACAKAWPPVLTKGKPRAVAGANSDLLGTTRRRNGRLQVTYAGQPLYYYVGDSPGTILCHDVDEFGGTWLVVQPDGSPAP